MEINIIEVKALIKEKFRNNKSWFAEEIGVDRAYLNQVLNGHAILHSPKICKGIIGFCTRNNLDYKKYIIFLHGNVKKINK